MAKNRSIDHALHNERTCKYLDKKPSYTDWVITTAFYSAYHFLQHKIFPLKTVDNLKDTIPDFNRYCIVNHIVNKKHHHFNLLVNATPENIAGCYKSLKNISWTARYNQYEFDRNISNEAKSNLKVIKEFCNSK
jgi:hypothetical protein